MSPSFADLGVPTQLVSSLRARGIDEPFPIQAATLPDALAGRDICGRAPTGSGKTIAFGIPLVLNVGKAKPRHPRGLVLVPTRELAGQVAEELQLLAKPKGPWVEAFYGGSRFDRQIKALQRGCDVVVACPGRLADLINQGYCDLSEVEFVVIDEADRMADMGFLPEVKRLLDQCNSKRQTLLFSATLDGDVTVLIKNYQHDPARHELVVDDDDDALAEHYFWKVDRLDRLKVAASIVNLLGPTIVFCRTKRGADRIAKQLDDKGVRAAAIHGDRSQSQRERALLSFHQGRVQALVATDVAARGIHVDGVAGVVHYDPPADHKDYVHRSGRTARAGNTGVVVSLVAPELRKAVGLIQKELGYAVGLDELDLRVLPSSVSGPSSTGSSPRPAPRSSDSRSTSRSSDTRPNSARVNDQSSRSARRLTPADEPQSVRHEPPPANRPSASRPASDRASVRSSGDGSTRRPSSHRSSQDRSANPVPQGGDEHSQPAQPVARAPRRGNEPARAIASTTSVDRVADLRREPLADGQRRPSGASRRKAKRLAAEAAVPGTGDDLVDRVDRADLRDGESSRTSKGSNWSKDSTRSPKRSGGPGRSGTPSSRSSATRSGAARPTSRAAAPKRGTSSPSRGSGSTGRGRPPSRSGSGSAR